MALATEGGIAAGAPAATSPSAAFLVSEDFDAVLSDLRVSSRFECRVLCLVDLPVVALSDCDASGRAIGACCRDWRWPCETYDQPCSRCQGRAPAGSEFHVTVSPFCPPPRRNEPLQRDLAEQKGSSGR